MTLGWECVCRSREFEEAARASPDMWFAYRAIYTRAPYDVARSRVNAQCQLLSPLVAPGVVLGIYTRSDSIVPNVYCAKPERRLMPICLCMSLSP